LERDYIVINVWMKVVSEM